MLRMRAVINHSGDMAMDPFGLRYVGQLLFALTIFAFAVGRGEAPDFRDTNLIAANPVSSPSCRFLSTYYCNAKPFKIQVH